MNKWHIVVDLEKCVGCFNCLMACKDEYVDNDWPPYTRKQQKHEDKWIEPRRHERGQAPRADLCFVPHVCQHCGNAPCAKAAPGAVQKRQDGIVLLDVRKARGNEELVKACPYGSIQWNEELKVAQKCTMCAHLLDEGWSEPRCVQACPLRALSVVSCSDEDWESMARRDDLRPITDGSNKPRVLYKNLYRYTECFAAGAVAYEEDGLEKAAINARVTLCRDGKELERQFVDFLGEFKFDRLPKQSGDYTVKCTMPGFRETEVAFTIDTESPDVGVIKLIKL